MLQLLLLDTKLNETLNVNGRRLYAYFFLRVLFDLELFVFLWQSVAAPPEKFLYNSFVSLTRSYTSHIWLLFTYFSLPYEPKRFLFQFSLIFAACAWMANDNIWTCVFCSPPLGSGIELVFLCICSWRGTLVSCLWACGRRSANLFYKLNLYVYV